MPESKRRPRRRRAAGSTAQPTAGSTAVTPARPRKKGPSPVWLAPLMVTLWLVGILWLVVFYISAGDMPVLADLGNGHLLIGFGVIVLGFALATQWR